MKILVISDEESTYYWDYFTKDKVEGIDLIISCGDLDPEYLSFLATMSGIPLLYVHGNHDAKYMRRPPEGCICIDDQIYVHEGIRILGLGGCMEYDGASCFQYTENEMRARVRKLFFPILKYQGIDLLVTHAPALGVGDGEDLPHRGFEIFRRIMDTCKPKYHLHGHVHLNYDYQNKGERVYNETTVINAYGRRIIEIS